MTDRVLTPEEALAVIQRLRRIADAAEAWVRLRRANAPRSQVTAAELRLVEAVEGQS